jgi:hypothetical protein
MHKPLSDRLSRRDALLTLAAAAGAAVLPRHAFADPQHLDVKDAAAVAAGYVENASQVDAKKYATYVPGSTCGNCLQLQGAAGPAYRPCDFFQGKLVAVAGWCSAWTAEM